MQKSVIGLVGPMGSGKGSVAKYLEGKGYKYTSLSDRIREELKRRGKLETRQNLQDVGDELRKQKGSGVLAEMTAKKYKDEDKLVVDSIRNPEEIRVLKDNFNATIVAVTASRRKRFELVKGRDRKGDVKTWNEFLKKDRREFSQSAGSHQIQITKCIEMADYKIENEGSKEDLVSAVDNLFKKITG